MYIMTAKLSKSKLIAIAAGAVLVIVALVLLIGGGSGAAAPDSATPIPAASNDERVAYLATFGWSVNAEPVQTQRVVIPADENDPVFARYNKLQKSQGFDLTDYSGKEAMRYVYEILNYPDPVTAPVYATLLVCDGCVIGGDVTCSGKGEPMHGLAMPS